MAEQTILAHFLERVQENADDVALFHKSRSVDWKSLTWGEYGELALKVARAFIAQGLQPGNSVAILSTNRHEVHLCYMASLLAGGRPTLLYPSTTPELVGHIVAHSEATLVVAENKTQFDKLKSAMARMPQLESIVVIEGAGNNKDLLSWDQLLSRGEGFPQTPLSRRLAEVDPSYQACLVYATGHSKMPRPVELSHGNMLAAAQGVFAALGAQTGDVWLSHIPMAHVLEQLFSIYLPILGAGKVWFNKEPESLHADLLDAHPTVFLAVPTQWEAIAQQLSARLDGAVPPGRVMRFANETAEEVNALRAVGDKPKGGLKVKYRLAEGLIYSKVKTQLGLDRARALLNTTDQLAPSLHTFFRRLDMPILEVYGLAEACGVVSMSTPTDQRTGSAGKPIEGVVVELSPEGEVLVSGPTVFTGYWQDPRRYAETVSGGVLRTGDLASEDDAGHLHVVDRIEHVLDLSTGERVAPQPIELAIKRIPEVSRAMIIGNALPYLTVLLTIHRELGMKWVRERGVNVVSMRELAGNMSFNSYMKAQLDAINEDLPRHEQIKTFKILERDLSEAQEELTPSLKLARGQIYAKHVDVIRKMYGDDWSTGA